MKQFVIKSVLFFMITVAIILFLYFSLTWLMLKRAHQFLKLPPETTTLFSGDSQVEVAIDDKLIPNSLNIAGSGEGYMYSYMKLKFLLEYNSQIRTIYLGYSQLDLTKSIEDERYYSDFYVVGWSHLNYQMTGKEKAFIFKHNPVAYAKGGFRSIKYYFITVIKSYLIKGFDISVSKYGGFYVRSGNKLKEERKRYSVKGKSNTFTRPEYEVGYLQMISRLCREKSVRLILLNTPKHKFNSIYYNKESRNFYFFVQRTVLNDSLLDLSHYPLPDEAFYDSHHLNYHGAVIFSKYIAKTILSSRVEKNVSEGR
jgi:hypothetical protein